MADAPAIKSNGRSKDISGEKFGRWVAQKVVGRATGAGTLWECVCECGVTKAVNRRSLIRGESKSCGCLRKEMTGDRFRGKRPGSWGHPRKGRGNYGITKKFKVEYWAWGDAIKRCKNPNDKNYHRYGGRGIFVCDRWLKGENGKSGFECFLEDVGPKPHPELSLDRIDNSGPYAPGNCRWTDRFTQARNKG